MDPSSEKVLIEVDDEIASTMTQPLLDLEAEGEQEGPIKEPPHKVSSNDKNVLPRKVRLLGLLTGFLVHALALGAYAMMVEQSGKRNKEELSKLAVSCLSFLTQIDFYMYVVIWIAFTCTLSGAGMKMLRARLGEHIQRRYVFVLGVYFLVGIVLGGFPAWYMVGYYLGFSVPLAPIVATVVVDLILCYLMIWCYDAAGTKPSPESKSEIAGSV
mmetsp:Transcript_18378/g.45562  ORF Transcript_18378/g.45562 Transcript_18378/m.45562 type:complete len:214 (+) Transcript_18378:2-643(+)